MFAARRLSGVLIYLSVFALVTLVPSSSAFSSSMMLGLKSAKRDTTAPTAPTSLRVTFTSRTAIGLAWKASRDNVSVAAYDVYVNGSLRATPRSTLFTMSGLNCGTAYTVAVEARDSAGNRSARTSIIASSGACTGVPSLPAATPTPASGTPSPSSVGGGGGGTVSTAVVTSAGTPALAPPTQLSVTLATTTQISVAWQAPGGASPTGYEIFLDGGLRGTPTSTFFTFSGLSCGTSHQVAVDATNSGGRHSAQTSITTTTAACPDTASRAFQPVCRSRR